MVIKLIIKMQIKVQIHRPHLEGVPCVVWYTAHRITSMRGLVHRTWNWFHARFGTPHMESLPCAVWFTAHGSDSMRGLVYRTWNCKGGNLIGFRVSVGFRYPTNDWSPHIKAILCAGDNDKHQSRAQVELCVRRLYRTDCTRPRKYSVLCAGIIDCAQGLLYLSVLIVGG